MLHRKIQIARRVRHFALHEGVDLVFARAVRSFVFSGIFGFGFRDFFQCPVDVIVRHLDIVDEHHRNAFENRVRMVSGTGQLIFRKF